MGWLQIVGFAGIVELNVALNLPWKPGKSEVDHGKILELNGLPSGNLT